ncbi:Ig-like domain-containing protein [Shewanella corallii]|uniref:Ig-like domain-containing protein n=1 Tax=Shewanella corallii TaxID=560080 RepID=A0ABT0N888_9GAMM|nr:RHS repeat-associated core domain-containing protein [Shewanella corallii]MCL2914654.1 Ig-like domain-containing protein [Shewanella corallii]
MNIVFKLFAFLLVLISYNANAITQYRNGEQVEILNESGQSKTLKFWTYDPKNDEYTNSGGRCDSESYHLRTIYISILNTSGSEVRRITLSASANNQHLFNLSPSSLNLTNGTYKFRQAVNYQLYETEDDPWGGNGCYSNTYDSPFFSEKTIKLVSRTKPVISSVSPQENQSYSINSNVTFTARASDVGGDVNKIEFTKNNSVVKRCSISTPSSSMECSFSTQLNSLGNYSVTVKAYDKYATISDPATRTVKVVEVNSPPQITSFSIGNSTLTPTSITDLIPIQVGDITTFIPRTISGVEGVDDSTIYIGTGTPLAINVSASDPNVASTNQLSSIRWCTNTSDDTSSCVAVHSCSVSGQTGSCNSSHSFSQADEYWIWAEVKDRAGSTVKSAAKKVVSIAPPSANIQISGLLMLGQTVNLSSGASGEGVLQVEFCYGPENYTGIDCLTSLGQCRGSNCGTSVFIANNFNSGPGHLYTVVTDGFGQRSRDGENVNIVGSYTLLAPSVTLAEGGEAYPGSIVNIAGQYRPQGEAGNQPSISRIEVYGNSQLLSRLNPDGSSTTFNFGEIPLPTAADVDYQFRLITDNGVTIYSPVTRFDVHETAPTSSPNVTADTSVSNGAFNIHLKASLVAFSQHYTWYESNGQCPGSDRVSLGDSEFVPIDGSVRKSIQKSDYALHDNRTYCYCASASNVNGAGPIGSGSECTSVTVDLPDSEPGLTTFSNMSLTQNSAYQMSWQNDYPGARRLTLSRKFGQPGSSYSWEVIGQGDNQFKQFYISQLPPGDVSYKVAACNDDDICNEGQVITVNHQVPYLHSATLTPAANSSPAEIIFDGLGLQGLTNANVQLRNTAEVFQFPVYQSSGDGQIRFRMQPNERVIEGYQHGGLRLRVVTDVGESVIEFTALGNTDRPDIDLIDASPTVSENGVVYVSAGQQVYALRDGYDVAGWPFSLPAGTASEARIVAAPTLDKDANGNDQIYFGATDRHVYKLSEQSNLLWRTRIRGEVHAQSQLLSTVLDTDTGIYRKQLFVGVAANGGNDVSGLYVLNTQYGSERYMYPLVQGVKQQPKVFANGELHVVTEDDQLHIIRRADWGPFALSWEDVDPSLVPADFEIDWDIPEHANIPLKPIASLFFGLLGRSPSEAELNYFAYVYWLGRGEHEITAAFLGSSRGLELYPADLSNAEFVNQLFVRLFPSEPNKESAGGLDKAGWVNLLNTGHPRSEVAWRLTISDEYYAYSANAVDLVTRVFYDHCNCNEGQDSDGDGVADSVEIELGYDALDPLDLIIAKPDLTASQPLLGDFSLSWQGVGSPDPSKSIFYRIVEGINSQPNSTLESQYGSTSYGVLKAVGNYTYQVQACIHNQICGPTSNIVDVQVSDSVVELEIQPEAPATSVAEYNPPQLNEISTSASLGLTTGEFRVNESGAATYSVPFSLPSGIAGVTPELGLAYSSQAPEGIVGVGWSLQGLSSISRCGSTKLLDGSARPVMLDEQDNFCMDGQRLLLKSGQQGQPGSVYTTQLDSQLTITYTADDSFEIERKDKSLSVYGGTAESKVTALFLMTVPGGVGDSGSVIEVTETMNWLISTTWDNLRSDVNKVSYVYRDGIGENEKVISEVNYSGNSVIINYSNDANPRVKSSGYMYLSHFETKSNISGITISNHDGVNVREYKLGFDTNEIGQRELLTIQECGLNNICKRPVEFNYRDVFSSSRDDSSWLENISTPEGEYLRHAIVLDVNNDGVNDLVTLTQVSSTRSKLCVGDSNNTESDCQTFTTWDDLQHNARLVPVDPDGDGLLSFLTNKDNNEDNADWILFDVAASNGFPVTLTLSEPQSPEVLGIEGNIALNLKAMDFDGDGYNDLVETIEENIYVRSWNITSNRFESRTPVLLPTRFPQGFKISNGWQSVDVNRDSVADILAWRDCGTDCPGYARGDALVLLTTNYQANTSDCRDTHCPPNTTDSYKATVYQKIDVTGKHALPVDFNSDGLSDVVVYNTIAERWEYYLNTGYHYVPGTDLPYSSRLNSSLPPMIVDYDGDGRIELVFHDKFDRTWYRYEWTNSEVTSLYGVSGGFERITPALSDWTFNPPTDDPEEPSFDSHVIAYGTFGDVNNNGLLDFLYKAGTRTAASTSLKLYNGGNRVRHPGLLNSITTGSGIETRITYQSMAEPFVHIKGEGLPSGMQQDPLFRVMNIAGAATVVTSVETDTPAQGSSEFAEVKYSYRGARAQFGRGSLGFESIVTVFNKQGVPFSTETEYGQVFPLTGMPLRTIKKAGGTIINAAENRYSVDSVDHGNGSISYRVYQNESRECQALVDSIEGSLVTTSVYNCQQTITVQDEYANVTSSLSGNYDVTDALMFVDMEDVFSTTLKAGALSSLSNSNHYGSSETDNRFGRLSHSTVTHSRSINGEELSETRNSSFTYYDNGMLKTEVIEPEGTCDTRLLTEYIYDDLGNIVNKMISNGSGCSPRITRTNTTFYDDTGRYILESYNSGVLNSKILQRNALGQATKLENTDGVVTRMLHDAFGTEVYRYSASGAQSSKLNKRCDDSSFYCFSMIEATENEVLTARQYIDTSGRVFKESTRDVLGNWHSKSQQYDQYGRAVSVIEPGLEPVTSEYDALDRVKATDDPNTGTVAYQTFEARNQTNTLTGDLPGGTQAKKTEFNALGEKYRITDAIGNVLTYTYDVFGNLDTVHSSADERVLSDIDYDKLGRKTQMIDEDRGTWTYEYDAFGQLTKQTDARGVITEIYYDDLGRKRHQKMTGTAEVVSEDIYWVYGTGSTKHRLLYEYTGSWRRDLYYDNLGRSVSTLTNLDATTECIAKAVFNSANNDLRLLDDVLTNPISSRCVIQQTKYDEYGRVFQQFDDYRRKQNGEYIEARGVRYHYAFNQVLKQQEAREGVSGRIYNEIVHIDDAGLLREYRKGNQTVALEYDAANRLSGISSGNHIQADIYSYDGINNLKTRQSIGQVNEDSFGYDELNRVTEVNGVQLYHYDVNGNLSEKDGWTLGYESDSDKPIHGVASRSKLGYATETYGYDANGNQIWGEKDGAAWRSISYSARNKANRIEVDGRASAFGYDANNRRFRRVDVGEDSSTTIFYVGNLELTIKETPGSGQQQSYIKRYVGDAMQTYYANGNSMLRWLYKDHLGSVTAISNESGQLVKRFAYDVFGNQTEIIPTEAERLAFYENTALSSLLLAEINPNTRGYTGHEPVAFDGDNRIVHMNGRMYDAALGRMLQADPVVQSPDNLQNYNSYSYVLNNPLNATDPSGYFIKKLIKTIADIPWLNSIVTVALNFIPGCQVWCSSLWNAAATYTQTGSWEAALTSGVGSAVIQSTFMVIGQSFNYEGAINAKAVKKGLIARESFIEFGGNLLTGGQVTGQISAHAFAGGIFSVIQGGKFGHGFFSAGITKGLGGAFLPGGGVEGFEKVKATVISAIIGGTSSSLSGGKFVNGAVTGAMQFLLNQNSKDEVSPQDEKIAMVVSGKAISKLIKGYGHELGFEIDSNGKFVLAADADLSSVRLQINSEGQVQFVSDYTAGGFTVADGQLNSLVLDVGLISVNLTGYENMVLNYDITFGAAVGVKVYGGFNLKEWAPIKMVHDEVERSNDIVCYYMNKYC